LVGSVVDALSPALQEPLMLPDYSKADQYMQSANINYDQARQDSLGVSNIASNNIRSMSNNAGSYMSRQSSRLAQLQDTLGRIGMSENNAQSQLDLQKGNYEAQKAQSNNQLRYNNQQSNYQNQANANLFDRTLSADLASIGTQFGEEARVQKAIQNNESLNKFNNAQILAALNSQYGNFQVSDDIIEQFKKGNINIDQLLKYKS